MSRTYYLGLGGSAHDFSAALIDESREIHAIEVERITRKRYGVNVIRPHVRCVKYLLSKLGIGIQQIKGICYDDMIFFDRYNNIKRHIINHHLAHAKTSFFTSKFKNSAILIADGVGSLKGPLTENRETVTTYIGSGNNISQETKIYGGPVEFRFKKEEPRIRSNSIGDLYKVGTQFAGFGYLRNGKLMGLSAYGNPSFYGALIQFIELRNNGIFSINMSPEDGIIYFLKQQNFTSFSEKANLACSIQLCTEKIIWHLLDHLYETSGVENLCLGGGVMLNSVMVGKIKKMTPFRNIYLHAASADNGNAIGAAIHALMEDNPGLKYNEYTRFNSAPFLGPKQSDIKFELINIENNTIKRIIQLIKEGKTVGIFQGRSEFGARALGNRSIIAYPAIKGIKQELNKLKGREWFRPVAPVVLESDYDTFFKGNKELPYMQAVSTIKHPAPINFSEAIHIDNTARVQIVRSTDRTLFSAILNTLKSNGDIPVIINTSLNVKGEPIVENRVDALTLFETSALKAIYINGKLYEK